MISPHLNPTRQARARRASPTVYRRRRVMVFVVIPLALALVIFGLVSLLGGSGSPPATSGGSQHTAALSTHPGVGIETLSLVDPSRTTYNYTTGVTTPGRHLSVAVRYPTEHATGSPATAAAPITAHNHFPLVVFAPGFRLRASDYAPLLDDWAKAGFVVAAVSFPDTTYPASEPPIAAGMPHGSPEADQYNEPADVGFVVSSLLADDHDKASFLDGALEPNKIAVAGHSDGGSVVAALTYDTNYDDPAVHPTAVVVLSGGEFSISSQTYRQPSPPAQLLVVQSATDLCAPPWQAVTLYDAIRGEKHFLELNNADHLGPYNGAEATPASRVDAVTTEFLKAALGVGGSSASVLSAGNVSGVSEITSAALATPIATPAGAASCPHD